MQNSNYHVVITGGKTHSLSFSLKPSIIYTIAFFGFILILALGFFCISFFIQKNNITALKHQLLTKHTKTENVIEAKQSLKTESFFWKAPKIINVEEENKLALALEHLSVSHDKNQVKINFGIKNTSSVRHAVGGYLFVMLVKRTGGKPEYFSKENFSVSSNGYPTNYKHGKNYWLAKNVSKNFQAKFEVPNDLDAYEEAMIFAYTYKGSVVLKRRIPLKEAVQI